MKVRLSRAAEAHVKKHVDYINSLDAELRERVIFTPSKTVTATDLVNEVLIHALAKDPNPNK